MLSAAYLARASASCVSATRTRPAASASVSWAFAARAEADSSAPVAALTCAVIDAVMPEVVPMTWRLNASAKLSPAFVPASVAC
ncbi:hypothetical protein, partial [Nocardia pseudovaccinii]|uniref:hypothetical protein n=1 Tax=Nocardia pseudovaccinii TaxID=189540 RepID=UPI0014711DF9